MANLFGKLNSLRYKKSTLSADITIADLVAEPFEVKILFYKKGTLVPAHTHSTDTLHIVLKGKIRVESPTGRGKPRIFEALGDYRCGGWEYRGRALADTHIMIIQEPGTTFVKSADPAFQPLG
ncbi:MAG TPA: hypothetical protein VN851_04845 [Thermoanaerobaculia bacterium]|nr:hypothetical protein [Thermoanaerobaculia bacterium]